VEIMTANNTTAPSQLQIDYLSAHSSFVIQLKNAGFEKLLRNSADLIIVDADDVSFSAKELAELTSKKTVLAYVSIGEAEERREYWRSYWAPNSPEWLYKENPEHPGEYQVRYWYAEWQNIVFQHLAELLVDGYSGVYLDTADAPLFWEFKNEPEAKQFMIDFLKKLSVSAQEIRSNALVFVQGSDVLVSDKLYLESIDGIGSEDVWFDDDARVSEEDSEKTLLYLDMVRAANKTVLVIDYPSDKKKRCEVRAKAQEKTYLAYTPTRELDKIVSVNC
ncbi:MAG: endo alpha-1,4 polygalactosaminidase, partial [Candidatus Woesearchaeota archaeon]|nr:endo alpha-1,4 polygalactosaminidase [Candidatus Woesearchaeota archaeon]